MPGTLLIQFAREPVPGKVKTRLLPVLSPQAACELHEQLVRHTARELVAAQLGDVHLLVAGDPQHRLFRACQDAGVNRLARQRGADLGQRMFNALREGLASYARVILVGSDCPQLDAAYLASALAVLDRDEVVLGPAEDGGYVLIGVRRVEAGWFRGVAWGSAQVYRQTAARLVASGASWGTLATLADVDRPADLPLWQALKARS